MTDGKHSSHKNANDLRMLYHWVYHMKMECEVCECDLGSTQCWIWDHRCMKGAGCYVISNGIVWYTVSLFPSYYNVYNKTGEQSPHPSCINLRSICGTCALRLPRGPLFTSRTVQTTWVVLGAVLPTSLATAGPFRCPDSPSLDIGSAAKMKECHMVNIDVNIDSRFLDVNIEQYRF